MCALLFVGSASGAPAWLAPQDLSAPGQDASNGDVAVDAEGNAYAVWARYNGAEYIVQASIRPAGGGWQPPQDLSASGQSAVNANVSVNGRGDAVAVWHRSNGVHDVVQAAFRPAGGVWQPAQDLSAVGQTASDGHVAVDSAGNAVAVWLRYNGSHYVAQATVRPFGGTWQLPAQDLSAAGQNAGSLDMAVGAAGDAIAIWIRSNGTNAIVQASHRPAGGAWQLPAANLSAAGQSADDPKVALDALGNAVAVWDRSNGTNDIVQASSRPAGAVWQAPENLSAVGQDAASADVDLGSGGNAVAVWRRSNGTNDIVQAAMRAAAGAWEMAKDLSAPGEDAGQARVALNESGNAVAVWRRADGTNYVVQAAARPSGGAWQASPNLSVPKPYASGPRIAADPAGNALAVWERRADIGTTDVIQAAPYDAAGPVLRNVRVPAAAFARQRIAFSVAPFDVWSALGGEPLWMFGDGVNASGLAVRHRYLRGGTYTVTLSLADALANVSTATRMLRVRVARCFGRAATIVGSSGPDRIRGTRRADVIVTLGGADRVRGRGGNDRICGGAGRDRLAGGGGDDRINGGPGRDICSQGRGRGRLVAC